MIERDGKKFWWCGDGHKWEGKECPMYCNHKPGAQHNRWLEQKQKWLAGRCKMGEKENKAPKNTDFGGTKSNDKKVDLSQSLQAALMTKSGISEDHFQSIWNKACKKLGNQMALNIGWGNVSNASSF